MNGDDRLGLEDKDGLYDGAGFGLTEWAGASVVSLSGARCLPIGGGEVSIAVDAIDILARTFGEAIGVGGGEDGYGSVLAYPGVAV